MWSLGFKPDLLPPMGDMAWAYAVSMAVYFSLHCVSRRLFGDAMINGTPRYNWVACGVGQVLVFPPLVLAGCLASGEGWAYFISTASAASPSAPYERAFLYAIAGQLAKDFAAPMNTLFIVHHIISGIMTQLMWLYPDGLRMALMGTAALELGSASQALSVLDAKCVWKAWVHFVVMAASNVIATAGSVWLAAAHGIFISWLTLFVVGAFGVVRQRVCHANCAHAGLRFGGAPPAGKPGTAKPAAD